jgi:hypothetical protein
MTTDPYFRRNRKAGISMDGPGLGGKDRTKLHTENKEHGQVITDAAGENVAMIVWENGCFHIQAWHAKRHSRGWMVDYARWTPEIGLKGRVKSKGWHSLEAAQHQVLAYYVEDQKAAKQAKQAEAERVDISDGALARTLGMHFKPRR